MLLPKNKFKNKFKDIDEEWLRKGTTEKILTNNSVINEASLLEDEKRTYQINCVNCLKKDKEIEILRADLMELQKQYIECLKEASALKNHALG